MEHNMFKINKFQYFFGLILILHLVNASNSTDERLERKKLYVLDNDACKLKRQDPWLLKRFYFNKTYIPCKQKRPFTKFERINNKVHVFLDPFRINLYRSRSADITCCISNITRAISANIPDNKIQESKCVLFDENGRAIVKNPIVKIRCFKIDNNHSVQAYENVYAFYLPDWISKDSAKSEAPKNVSFNVLMIGVGSMSRQNVLRTWPKTSSYLSAEGWLNFEGYSQVGETTMANLLPILSGCSEKQAEKAFQTQWGEFYDNYELIWNEYQTKGYITSFAEDHSHYAIFSSTWNGFITPPTDFYFRPYTVASDKLQTSSLDRMPHCMGNQNAAERILNLATDLVHTFQNKSYFGLFWLNTFSVEDLNAPSRMDKKMMEFFKNLEPHLNRTFVIFFSDHGFTKHNITRFKLALLESRQPLLYIQVPDYFKFHFVKEYEWIKENTKRLTSPFDLYVTLHDILRLSGTGHETAYASSCRKCNSLLRKIPEVRSCADAGIEDNYCICSEEIAPPNVTYLKATKNVENLGNKVNVNALIVILVISNIIIEYYRG